MKSIILPSILCLSLLSCSNNRKTDEVAAIQQDGQELKGQHSSPMPELKKSGKPGKEENKLSSEKTAIVANDFKTGLAENIDQQHSNTHPQKSDPSVMHFEKKIIKNANMRIEVADYKKARLTILALAGKFHGYIAAENELTSNSAIENDMVIRASGNEFDSIIENIAGLAKKTEHKDIKADDVTAEYYDLETRLKTEREVQKRYLEMLSHAKKVDEMMEVQEKIDEITEEIESKEGQIRVMNDQATYSTLNLTFYQELPFKPTASSNNGPGFFYRAGIAIGKGWQGFLTLIVFLAGIWPVIIISALGYISLRWYRIHRLVK